MSTHSSQAGSGDDPLEGLHYLYSDYAATGEGRTVSLLVTTLTPRGRDWLTKPGFVVGKGYRPGILARSVEDILLRQFAETFDSWFARGMERLDRESFIERAGEMLPAPVRRALERDVYGNLHYSAQFHLTF